MLKVKAGDLDKLGLLFERYNRKLFSFFYRLTYRRDISEDLVQGVFERIIKYRHTYEGEGAFSTWIYQVARNLHVDHYRKNKRYVDNNDFDNAKELIDKSEQPEFDTNEETELKLLKKALDKLTPEKKETLVLSRFQGLKYKEIADIMNCSESAVKVRIFRAINELKEIITELKKNKNYDT